jgi:hypothetical protein
MLSREKLCKENRFVITMLTMSPEAKKKTYPTIAARVTEEQMARFLRLLERVRLRDPRVKKPDLARMLMGFDLLTEITQEERDFISGKIDCLPMPEGMASQAEREDGVSTPKPRKGRSAAMG